MIAYAAGTYVDWLVSNPCKSGVWLCGLFAGFRELALWCGSFLIAVSQASGFAVHLTAS